MVPWASSPHLCIFPFLPSQRSQCRPCCRSCLRLCWPHRFRRSHDLTGLHTLIDALQSSLGRATTSISSLATGDGIAGREGGGRRRLWGRGVEEGREEEDCDWLRESGGGGGGRKWILKTIGLYICPVACKRHCFVVFHFPILVYCFLWSWVSKWVTRSCSLYTTTVFVPKFARGSEPSILTWPILWLRKNNHVGSPGRLDPEIKRTSIAWTETQLTRDEGSF